MDGSGLFETSFGHMPCVRGHLAGSLPCAGHSGSGPLPCAKFRKPNPIAKKALDNSNAIALVSADSDTAWCGFSTISDAIVFKMSCGMTERWRIRDRRAANTGRDTILQDAMLVVGTMILDHLRNLSSVYGSGKLPLVVRREMIMFAATTLREVLIGCERDIGRWRPMRGKFCHPTTGVEISHAWLEDDHGNVLDVLPWNGAERGPIWYSAGGETRRIFDGLCKMSDGYGTATGNVLRGRQSHPETAISQIEFARLNVVLGSHIEAFLKRSRLPVMTEVA